MNLEDRRKELEKEAWIKNVIRVTGMNRIEAEEYYQKILQFSENRPKISVDEMVDQIVKSNFKAK